MILACKNIKKSYGIEDVLRDINFQINEGEKVALVGINGAGKSTLFKIITGNETKDSGEVILKSNATLAYLSQHVFMNSDKTIYEEIKDSRPDILDMERRLKDLELKMSSHFEDEKLFDKITKDYTLLQHQFELADGYSYYSRIKGILYGLSFKDEDFTREISSLSGGQKTRLALAKLLLKEPDILLLDEPTNHLDITSTEWLENYLSSYNKTLIIISHDRYFLDHVVHKVIEIEHGKSKVYTGNYSFFIKNKTINASILEKHYENQQKEIHRQEEIIKQLKSFNREKSVKRAESKEKQLQKVERIEKPISLNDTMHFELNPKITGSNDVLTVRELSKTFDDNTLFNNVNIDIKRGEKIALIGANGSGKSTIFKILRKEILEYEGSFKLGSKIHIGYYDQEHSSLDEEQTLFSEIANEYPTLTETTIRNTLAAFLFRGDDVYSKISTLSGGEKGRLSLAKIILSKANFLMLDEPTNHLDIVSKSVLENALKGYTGTLFFISHDRYFINQVATRVIDLRNKKITNYLGNYDYYVEKRDKIQLDEASPKEAKASSHKETWLKNKEIERDKKKREKALKELEDKIHDLETKIASLDEELCSEALMTNYSKLNEITKEKEAIERDLENLYEEWESLTNEE